MEGIEARKPLHKQWSFWLIVVVVFLITVAVVTTFIKKNKNPFDLDQNKSSGQDYSPAGLDEKAGKNIDPENPPQIVQADFVELDKVYMISKFRSGTGHDFSNKDGTGETCRSMKHYFSSMDPSQPDYKAENGMEKSSMPMPTIDKDVKIFAPNDGTLSVINFDDVPFNQEIDIVPSQNPEFLYRIMHAQLAPGIKSGQKVTAGQTIGLVLANQSFDLAVAIYKNDKSYLVSYFDILPDNIFAKYQARGVTDRSELITTKEYRDAHPFACQPGSEQFVGNYAQEDLVGNLVQLSGYNEINAQIQAKYKDIFKNKQF